MPDRFHVEIAPSQNVTALRYPAAPGNPAGVTLILGHGAGADQTSVLMVAFATALAQRGIDIVTFNFLYSEHGRRIPDPNGRLESCWRAVIETVQARTISGAGKLAIGGKSMGGRIAAQVAAGGDHSFKVPKSAGIRQAEVHRAIQDRIETWLRMIASG